MITQMMTEETYFVIYNCVIALTFVASLLWPKRTPVKVNFLGWGMITYLVFLFANRDLETGEDTMMYWWMYQEAAEMTFTQWLKLLGEQASEPLFAIVLIAGKFIGGFTESLGLISFLTLAMAYNFSMRLSAKLKDRNPVAILCIYLSAFYIFSQQINIIRAGLAAVFILNFYLSFFERKKKSSIVYAILSIGIHFSSALPLAVAVLCRFWKFSRKTGIIIFMVFLILAFFDWGILDIPGIKDSSFAKVSTYTNLKFEDYNTGFRGGFAVFNLFFLYVFYLLWKKRDYLYSDLFRLFIILSCVFFISFQIPYSDRIGAFSWNIVPFLSLIGFDNKFTRKGNLNRIICYLFIASISIGLNIATYNPR